MKLQHEIIFNINKQLVKCKQIIDTNCKQTVDQNCKQINVIEDKDSGEPRLSHRIDLSTGMYNGRQVIKQKSIKDK